MQKALLIRAGALLAWLLVATQAGAEPQFARMYKDRYGYPPSCNACHTNGGGTDLNPFGQAFKKAGKNPVAFDAIAKLDSDGDGFANDDEAKAQANPGSAKSTPKNKTDWLDTANLIPKQVQQAFPGVTDYKPLDTILTAKEIGLAQGMGVTVTQKDQNTIYVPVKDGKAIGTAIIVPAEFKGKDFFLLVATDGRLNINTVSPVNTKDVPEAQKSKAYPGLVGLNAAKLPAPADPASLDGAINAAVKKAGVMLYVRLKQE
jgi:mono/diheme cytochrome c family protein